MIIITITIIIITIIIITIIITIAVIIIIIITIIIFITRLRKSFMWHLKFVRSEKEGKEDVAEA